MSAKTELYKEIAKYYCTLFVQYSREPIAIDRLLPEYRVGRSDIMAQYPELNLTDWTELQPYIAAEMRRRGLKYK